MTASAAALFVDDEPSVLAGISLTLRHRNFRVLTAGGATEAFDHLAAEPVAVVVSDEDMPGMTGTAFLSEVRRRHPDVVRVVLSGSADPRGISKAVNEAGLFRYLLKPCTPADLILAVEQSLEAHGTNRGLRPRPRPALDLDDAIRHLQIQMQPIYGSRTSRLFAHEALLRLPERFGVGPLEMLDAAEHEDRLWTVERAIRAEVARRIPERPDGSQIFVNVHPHSLMDPQLYNGFDPLTTHAHAVVLEITERSSLAEMADLPDRMAALRALGYRIAIDDLGSGYSGLNALVGLLPDFVKFDRDLVQGMHESTAKRRLIGSLATVCVGLGIATVAEGIEREEDLVAVRAAGCSYAQGYLLARPAPCFRLESIYSRP